MINQLVVYKLNVANEDRFHERFRDHTKGAMARLGFNVLGLWTAVARPPNPDAPPEVVYLLSWPDEAALAKGWADLNADPEHAAIRKFTEETFGAFVIGIENRILTATDYGHAIGPNGTAVNA